MARKEDTEHVKVIQTLERLKLSVNGNPRFRVTFTDGTVAETQSDNALNYGIENPKFRDFPVRVKFTRAGKISSLEVA